MKCRGIKCNKFFNGNDYKWCYELNTYLSQDGECNLLENIQKTRDDLIRRCRLFEEVFEIDCSDSLDNEIEKMEV